MAIPFALNPNLQELKGKNIKKTSPENQAKADQFLSELKEKMFAKNGIQVGNKMPNFILPNAVNKPISSAQFLRKGGLVINFYRGEWCPYCNLELSALRRILPQIRAYGADLVAISPETPDNSLTLIQKLHLEFEVLSDTDNQFAKQIGIAFEVPNYLVKVYQGFGLHVNERNNSDKFEKVI